MLRGPLSEKDYRPSFSGHETFPLRYGWLKKAYDVIINEDHLNNKTIFTDEMAVSRFGVGKNMVSSIYHWCLVTGIIEEDMKTKNLKVSDIGTLIFSEEGDPYLERLMTLWLLHWNLATNSKKTTLFWAFNHFPTQAFSRDQLTQDLANVCSAQTSWKAPAENTLKRDVDCFVRTYSSLTSSKIQSFEEVLESPLSELNIIRSMGRRDIFRFSRGEKSSLPDSVFIFSLIDFWIKFSSSQTMTFEKICYEPGSPGRIFMLDEDTLVERLSRIGESSNNLFQWSETAGLKQIICESKLDYDQALMFIKNDYELKTSKSVA